VGAKVNAEERGALSDLMMALDRILDVPYTANGYAEAHRELALDIRVERARAAARLVAEHGDLTAMQSMTGLLRTYTPEHDGQEAEAEAG
jgi:hypothetical protein